MSEAGTAPWSEMHSGLIQFGVPWTSFVAPPNPCVVFLIACRFSETPKSLNFVLPVFVERMFAAADLMTEGGERENHDVGPDRQEFQFRTPSLLAQIFENEREG